jgi:hypothetical protein
VTLDFPAKTISFAKNGACPGVAFSNLNGPVRAAASLTPTNAQVQVRLCFPPLHPSSSFGFLVLGREFLRVILGN